VKLDFAFLADGAVVANNKVYAHGAGLRRVDVPTLPWSLQLSLAIRLTVGLDEPDAVHAIQVRLFAPSGDQVAEYAPLTLNLAKPEPMPSDWDEISAFAVIEFVLGVGEAGWWRFEVTLDEEPLSTLPLKVAVAPQPVAPS
jgi:hypothetical protein